MIDDKVVLTYKRKRLSSRSDLDPGVEGSSLPSNSPRRLQQTLLSQKVKVDSNTFDEKLKGNNACIVCNAGRSLLGCDSCSKTFHLQCAEPPLKYIPQGKWRCAACVDQHDSERSLQQRVRESNRARKYRSIKESEMGPMKLRSCKVLLVKNLDKSSSGKTESSGIDVSFYRKSNCVDREYSLANVEPADQVKCVEEGTGCPILDLSLEKTSVPAWLDSSSAIKFRSGCPEDLSLKTSVFAKNDSSVKLENLSSSDMVLKKHTSTPLITFRRRAKIAKGVDGKTDIQNSMMLEGRKDSAVNHRHDASHTRCKYEDTCHECSSINQPTDATAFQKDLMHSPLHAAGEDKVVNIEVGDSSEPSRGGSLERKMSEGSPLHCIQRANLFHQTSLHCEHSKGDQEDPAVIIAARCSSNDIPKVSPFEVHESKHSNSPEIGTPIREESGIRSINSGEKPEGVIAPEDISKSDSLVNLELSTVSPNMTSLCSVAWNKSSSGDVPANFLESQISPPSSHATMSSAQEANGRGKQLELLETIDEELQVPWKERRICSSMSEGRFSNCRQSSDNIASHLVTTSSHVHLPFEQTYCRETLNRISPCQEIIAKSGNSGSNQMHHTSTNKSSVCANFLALSLPQAQTAVYVSKDFLSDPLLPTSRMNGTGYLNEKLPWQVSDEKSTLSGHRQVIDDILSGSRMLKQRQGYSLEKFKRFQSTWSEEELDSLWMGVRRYGRGNWHGMLRDPKLRFMEWRVAEDLANRWSVEQSKLLDGSLMHPMGMSKPVLSSCSVVSDSILSKPARSCYTTNGSSSLGYSEFRTIPTETNLSLGDVYLRKEKSITSRSPFQPLGLATMPPVAPVDSQIAGSHLINGQHTICSVMGAVQRSPCKTPQTRFNWGSSNFQQQNERFTNHEHQPANSPASSNLPHWLKEVFNVTPPPSDPILPSGVSEVPCSGSAHDNDLHAISLFPDSGDPPAPTNDQSRVILERVAVHGNSAGHLNISNLSPSTSESWMARRLKHLPTLGLSSLNSAPVNGVTYMESNVSDLKRSALDPVGQNNLVVIDSDASSEETISDEQSGMP